MYTHEYLILYIVQEGFGWTNGVILDFLTRYGAEFTLNEFTDQPATSQTVTYKVDTDQTGTCNADAETCGAQTMQTLNHVYLAFLMFCISSSTFY